MVLTGCQRLVPCPVASCHRRRPHQPRTSGKLPIFPRWPAWGAAVDRSRVASYPTRYWWPPFH